VTFVGNTCAATCTILAGNNVSSVIHDGAGTYTVVFATALTDANYAPFVSNAYFDYAIVVAQTASQALITTGYVSTLGNSWITDDSTLVSFAAFR
jgi:hypothetical protein